MTVTQECDDHGCTVVMTGRLDVRTVPDLRLTLHHIIDAGNANVLLDLSEAEIGDSTAIGMLVECLQRARRAGVRLRVAVRDGRSMRLLRQARLGSVIVPAADGTPSPTDLAVAGVGAQAG